VKKSSEGFQCSLQLPINSPYKDLIQGPPMPSLELAKRAAALEACKLLHGIKEVDDYMMPIGKDGPKKEWEPKPRFLFFKQIAEDF
jgi:endoribonuclease Dicer